MPNITGTSPMAPPSKDVWEMRSSEPSKVLYIWIRTDLESMVPGKAAAQACHAANMLSASDSDSSAYIEWAGDRGFGTTITLKGDINKHLDDISVSGNSGIVLDPTYPIRDGSFTHLVPLITCWWAFIAPPVEGELY